MANELVDIVKKNQANVLRNVGSDLITTDELVGAIPMVEQSDGSFAPEKPTVQEGSGDLEGAVEIGVNPVGHGEPTIRNVLDGEVPPEKKHYSWPEYIKTKYEKGKAPFIKSSYGMAILNGTMTVEEALEKGNAEYLKHLESIGKLEDVSFGERPVLAALGEASQLLPFMIDTALESAKHALIGGSVGAVAGLMAGGLSAPALAAGGATAGGMYGVIKNTLDVEGMNILFDLVNEGIPKETAIPLAVAGGVAIGVTELFQLRLFGAGFKRIVAKAMIDKVSKSALLNAATLWAKNTGVQTAQEGIQSSIELATKFLASIIEKNPDVLPTRGDMVDEMVGVLKGAAGMAVLGVPSAVAAGVQTKVITRQEAIEKATEKFEIEQEEREIEIVVEPTITQEQKLKRGVKAFKEEEAISKAKLKQTLPPEVVEQGKVGSKDIDRKDDIDIEGGLPDGGSLILKRKDLVGRVNFLSDKKKDVNKSLNKILTEVSKTKDPLAVKRLHTETLKLLDKKTALEKEIASLSAVENRAARQLGVKKVLLSAKEVVALEQAVVEAKMKGIERGIKQGKKISREEILDVQSSYAGFIMRAVSDEKVKLAVMKDVISVQTAEQFNKKLDKNLARLKRAADRMKKKALIRDIKKLSKPKKLAKVSSEFLPSINAILNPFSVTKPTKKTTAKLVWLAKELRESKANQIDAEALRVLEKLDKRPLADLEVSEIEMIRDSVAHLLHLNSQKQKLNEQNRTEQQEKNVNEAVKNVNERFEKLEGSVDGLDDMLVEKETEIFKFGTGMIKDVLGAAAWNTELISEILDGKDSGIIMKVFYNAIDDGTSVAINYRTNSEQFLVDNGMRKLVDKSWSHSFTMFKKKVKQETIVLESGKKIKLTKGRKVSIILLARNENSRKHLRDGGFNFDTSKTAENIRLTENDLNNIAERASADETKVADIIYSFFNTMQKDSINEVSERLLGYSIATEENYFPINVNRLNIIKEESSIGLTSQQEFVRKTLEGMGIFKKRTNSSEPIVISDAFDVLTNQIRQVSNFVGLAEPLRNAKSMLNSNEFRTAVTKAGKGKYLISLQDYLDKIEGSIYTNDKIGRLLQGWQQRIDVAVLAGNVGVFFKQPVSYFLASTEMKAKYLATSFSPKASNTLVDKMKKWSPQARERFDGNITLETGEVAGSGASKRMILGESPLSNHLMIGIHKFDKAAVTSIWRAVEKETRAEHKNLKPDSDQFNQHVADRWWKVVRRTQPTFDIKDRSYGGRSTNTWFRLATKYSSQRNKNWMIQRRAIEKYNRTDGHPVSALAELTRVTMIIRFITPAMIAGVNALRALGQEHPKDDPSDEWSGLKRFFLDWVRTTLGDVYIISPILSTALERFEKRGKGFGMTDPLTRNFEQVGELAGDIITLATNAVNKDNTRQGRVKTKQQQQQFVERMFKNSLDITSKITGIPAASTLRSLEVIGKGTGLVEKDNKSSNYNRRRY